MQSTAILLPTTTDDPFHEFESLTLDPARFTHRLHLTFAWRYLQRDGFPEGAVQFARQLKAYVEHVGAASKYHETITWAYLALLNEERVLNAGRDDDFEAVLRRRPDLLDHRGGAIAQCYTPAQLRRPGASRVFILPRMECGHEASSEHQTEGSGPRPLDSTRPGEPTTGPLRSV